MKHVLTVLLLIVSHCSFSQSQHQIIDSLFNGTNGLKTTFPEVGLVIGIYDHGQTHYYSTGTRHKNGTESPDSATIFEIGSATKTFTSLLLAQAMQNGKVRQNDFIDKYLVRNVRLPVALRNKIKLTDLASHQSGLPNLSNDSYFDTLLKQHPRNPFQMVNESYLYSVLTKTDSLRNYGQYRYNNYAFSLLGNLLAKINRTTYASLLHKSILRPMQMVHTTLTVPATTNVAGLYNQQGEPQEYLVLNAVNPAGGLKSNAMDLMKYLKAHLFATTYSKAIRLTQQPFYKDEKRTVGLGWDVQEDYYQKDGDTFGNSMLMRYSPSRQLAIVVLSNHQNGQLVSDAVDFIYKSLKK